MADLIITPSGSGAISLSVFVGDGSDLLTAGKFWLNRPAAMTPKYGREEFKGPQQEGRSMRRSNFDCQWIENIELQYVNTSAAAVLADFQGDQDSLMDVEGGCEMALPDWPDSFPACECYEFEPIVFHDGDLIKPTGVGSPATVRMKVRARFKQLRLS